MAIRACKLESGYPIELSCQLLRVSLSAYNKWASGKLGRRAAENERFAEKIEKIHTESPDKGYRRINDDLRHDQDIHVNDKRVLRICRAKISCPPASTPVTAAPGRQRIHSISPKIFWDASFMPKSQMKNGLPM